MKIVSKTTAVLVGCALLGSLSVLTVLNNKKEPEILSGRCEATIAKFDALAKEAAAKGLEKDVNIAVQGQLLAQQLRRIEYTLEAEKHLLIAKMEVLKHPSEAGIRNVGIPAAESELALDKAKIEAMAPGGEQYEAAVSSSVASYLASAKKP